ncbi:MAG: DotI/IcmL/TraM family protein [Deltaproteobacteria bacterium]|jgi:hypothetical protein|nr:DotI/IcmL/TraM family protein [Deltaproteobacteria bacterium]
MSDKRKIITLANPAEAIKTGQSSSVVTIALSPETISSQITGQTITDHTMTDPAMTDQTIIDPIIIDPATTNQIMTDQATTSQTTSQSTHLQSAAQPALKVKSKTQSSKNLSLAQPINEPVIVTSDKLQPNKRAKNGRFLSPNTLANDLNKDLTLENAELDLNDSSLDSLDLDIDKARSVNYVKMDPEPNPSALERTRDLFTIKRPLDQFANLMEPTPQPTDASSSATLESEHLQSLQAKPLISLQSTSLSPSNSQILKFLKAIPLGALKAKPSSSPKSKSLGRPRSKPRASAESSFLDVQDLQIISSAKTITTPSTNNLSCRDLADLDEPTFFQELIKKAYRPNSIANFKTNVDVFDLTNNGSSQVKMIDPSIPSTTDQDLVNSWRSSHDVALIESTPTSLAWDCGEPSRASQALEASETLPTTLASSSSLASANRKPPSSWPLPQSHDHLNPAAIDLISCPPSLSPRPDSSELVSRELPLVSPLPPIENKNKSELSPTTTESNSGHFLHPRDQEPAQLEPAHIPPTNWPRPGSSGAGLPPSAPAAVLQNPAAVSLDPMSALPAPASALSAQSSVLPTQSTVSPSQTTIFQEQSTPSPGAEESQWLKDGLEPGKTLPTLSLNWYLKQNRELFHFIKAVALGILLLILTNVYLATQRPQPRFFWITPDLRVNEATPLEQPLLHTTALSDWAAKVLTKALSLDYLHWEEKLNDLKASFSKEGHAEFVNSLERSGHIKKIVAEKLILRCELAGAPIITDTREEGDQLTWILEAPVIISYHASSGAITTQKLLAEMEARWETSNPNHLGARMNRLALVKIGSL